jgi:hypothetical protein
MTQILVYLLKNFVFQQHGGWIEALRRLAGRRIHTPAGFCPYYRGLHPRPAAQILAFTAASRQQKQLVKIGREGAKKE